MTLAGNSLSIFVNDEQRPIAQGTCIPDLLATLGVAGRDGVAVAINAAVVPRQGWAERRLQEGDRVLIIQASQGG